MDQQQRIDGSSDYAQIPVNVRGGGLASSNKYQNYDDIPVGGSGSRGGYDYSGSSNFSASSMIPNSDASVGSMNMQNLLGSTTTTTTSSSASTMMQPPAQPGIPQQPLDSDYTTLVHRLKQHIFGYDNDYSRDTSFQVPLVLPEGVKTSITEVPEQLQKMLAEREPTFDRELPTRDFFKDIPEREVVRHRIVHPVQVQTIKHIVTHPPKRIEVRHTAPHIVEHVVEHEIPHEIQHVVQHVVPYSVEHVISHDVKENVKHVLSHKVHQLVNHDIKEEIKHNILHGVQKFQQPGMNESEIQEDNRIPHSVTRSAPLINTSITNRLIEDFQERLHLSGATGIERTERTITATDLISSNPQQQEGMGSAMQQPIGPGLGGAALDGASSMPMKGRSSVAAAEAERVDSASA